MRDFHLPGRSAVYATNGMCATSHPLAAKVAVQMLEEGGNAVDAAIAGAVLLGLLEPQMTGIGGDCFALIKPAGSEDIVGLNGSGRAPAALSAEALRAEGHKDMPLYGSPHSVTLPGAIDAFDRMMNDYGTMGLARVLAPSIRYFEEGAPVAPRVSSDWAASQGNLSGRARDLFMVNGAAPRPGQMFRAEGQAEVLRRIAAEGRKGFYEGEVAEDMVASLQAMGGVHTMDDFAAVACDYVDPISGTYQGAELVELPPNGQGATAILMANILEQFDVASLDPWGAKRAHLEAEAAKLAYDARNRFIADPDKADVKLAHMLSDDTAKALAKLIDPERAMTSATEISEAVHKDTIYITVVDKNRMAVSLIYSIFHSFGSGLASDKFGINFQNRGAGFTLDAGHPNEAAGGKRPMHTIIPAMLKEDGRVTMPFGVMGGAYQPNGHVRFLSNLRDFGMTSQAAIDGPRCFGAMGAMDIENGYDRSVWDKLTAMGHRCKTPQTAIGGAQSIWIGENGVLVGASDPRKDGCALGY
ncbi:gamma-glutamyltranspeptidase/glutathione hydrolase [Rubricella aquisinus]|uniref:Gamma-glutamyltranspeptidase/glutathione hydrolase n=1 Tax=Rubricella aquisinus TaxID=2028108 RepID=A0A840WH17_9RHOB|nr:gamma-glutamyltransferase family protein [Rubricella aquisinus]MBB5514409.1 gamma-glutamyltranspeptidase/glutathione hydrolase [Rubricella aquisinus]